MSLPRLASTINQEWNELPTAPNPDISRFVYSSGLKHSGKNRYPDVLPFEETRVKLSNPEDYINANYVQINSRGRFISTQAPLPQTFITFWKMVWENNAPVIVMLTKIMEKRKIKAHCYWPAVGETEIFGDLHVTLISEEIQDKFIIVREMQLRNTSTVENPRRLCHIQYTEWPDFGVPRSTDIIRKVLDLSDNYRTRFAIDNQETVIVHCSAGIGRAGTFLAIQSVVDMIKNNVPVTNISIKEIVSSLRKCRMEMVQTKEQYKFIYQVMEDIALITGHSFTDSFGKKRTSEEKICLTRSYADLPSSQTFDTTSFNHTLNDFDFRNFALSNSVCE